MNSTDRFLSGRANGNAAALDTELRLGLQQCAAQQPYLCSLCTKSFTSLHLLAGHQMVHRWEVEKLRRKHQAFLAESAAAVRSLDQVKENASSANLQPPREKKQLAVDDDEEEEEEEEEDGSVDLELKLRVGGLDLSLRL